MIVGQLGTTDAAAVEQQLEATSTFDVLAGWVVHACRQRILWGWPALTADPGRLQRVNPDVDVDLL